MNQVQIYTIVRRAVIMLLILLVMPQLFAQNPQQKTTAYEVTGVVKDHQDNPVKGALLTLQERIESVQSDSAGTFRMNVLSSDILICKNKGYSTQKISMKAGSRHVEISMEPLLHDEEAVEVAFGTYSKRALAGSMSTIHSDKVKKNAVNQIEQAMNGTLSGLYSVKNGGQEFSRSNYNYYLRGIATTGDARPLILVDGVDGNIDLLDPKEVESITVLKDAAELAMYGVRGANGVILITTKRGNTENNFMNVEMKLGVQTPAVISDKLNSYQYTTLHNEANVNDGKSPIYDPEQYLNPDDPYRYADTDFPGLFLKDKSMFQNYTFSTGGGNDVAQYYCLVGYMKQDGLFDLPSGYDGVNQANNERFNFRTNLDVALGKGFSLNTNIAAVYDERRSPWMNTTVSSSNNSLFNKLMTIPASAYPLINPDGSLGGTAEYLDNPLGLLQAGRRRESTRQLTAQVKLVKDLSYYVKGLSANVMYGFENFNSYYQGRYTKFAVYQLEADDTYTQYGTEDTKVTATGGQMSDYYNDMNVTAGLDYNRRFGKHQLTGTLVYNQYTIRVSGDNPAYKWLGTSGRLLYGFNNRYFAQFTAAYHGSNNFARGERYDFFPAAAVAWVMSEEDFLQTSAFISYLKMRASYGLTGNDRNGGSRFMYRQSFYNKGGYGFGNPNGSSKGAYEGTLGNPDATWETAAKFNLGIDFGAMENALNLSVDYFHENRSDILVQQANVVPALIGIGLPQYNAGRITNQGVELDVNYSKRFGNLLVSTGFNIMMVKSNIEDLKEVAYPEQEQYRNRQGHAVTSRFGFIADGLYTNQSEIDAAGLVSSFGQLAPGDIKYRDMNGDGVINDADKTVIGHSLPETIYGVNLALEYKGFDFYCLGEGAANYETHIRPGQFSTYAYLNRWISESESAASTYPRLTFESEHNQQTSTYWQEKGKLFRLATIEVGYTLPDNWVRRLAVSKVRMYINADHVYSTMNDREGRDFEAPGAGYTEYPMMKTVQFGLSVNL
ncbi:MAG: SusC/RagA family TonB-linked outer membrane protein [Marinilabiliaceae bacterium]|nr:SusC/RagA family TonB-linked outer membrane protein [Marinilabiliaceae bacterium]